MATAQPNGTVVVVIGETGPQGPAGAANVPDASTIQKGVVQLAGDLSGTSTAPTVPGLLDKVKFTTSSSDPFGSDPTPHVWIKLIINSDHSVSLDDIFTGGTG